MPIQHYQISTTRMLWFSPLRSHFQTLHTKILRACLVHVFKNWKLLFENICENTCGWKSALKYVKCCLKTENCCLKIQTKRPLNNLKRMLFYRKKKKLKKKYFPEKNICLSVWEVEHAQIKKKMLKKNYFPTYIVLV